MSNTPKQFQRDPAANGSGSSIFSCLEDLLAHYARMSPRHFAVLSPGHAPLTYGALWRWVNETVRELRTLGVGRTDRVAVVLPEGPETAMTIIAVAAGAVCVPLYPGFTAGEWQRYFSDLKIAALLTRADMNSASREVAHTLGIPIVYLSRRDNERLNALKFVWSTTRRPVNDGFARTNDDALMLLTSGTTSRPKMVPLTHANVCLSAYNVGSTLALSPRDRLLHVLPLFHGHGLISGVLAALAAGSSVVCTTGFEPTSFFDYLQEFRPTWYTAVPAVHQALLSEARRNKHATRRCSLRLVRSASSSLPSEVLRGLEALFCVPVIETYGMTEAATQIAANPLTRPKVGSVGQPAGAEIAIMDGAGRRLPAGERGEILLRGPTIMRGYYNHPIANAAAFRDGWFRTGDLGYLDSDKYLFIVGRIKKADVINRGGQKVSPAEVEEALLSHPEVVQAVVGPVAHRRLGQDVAAVVVLRSDSILNAHTLRRFVGKRLAVFKVPGLIRIVPNIPTGPDGTIDRGGFASILSMSKAQSHRHARMVAPRSELEWQLAKTWAELLELSQVGVDQDIFALGADSITVMQMVSRLRVRYGIDLSFKDIFDAPTVAALATRVESSERQVTAASLTSRETNNRIVPLSFQQQRIYVLSRLDPIGYTYQLVEVAHLSGPLDVGALEASIERICDRHEVLRSTFHERLGEPVQIVGSVWPRLEHLDLAPCAKSKRTAVIQLQATEWLHQPFNIEGGEPLVRARLLRLDKDDHSLVIKIHHLITDGWSQRLFWEELEALYAAKLKGTASEVPDLPVQYRHFIEWQRAWLRTRAAEDQLGYWRARLEGLTDLPLPTDRPRPAIWTGRGARHRFKFSRALSRAIKAVTRAHRVTLFMTLLAAFQSLLYRYTNQEDIAVGSLIANRNQIQNERLIGMFANTIVLRTDFSGDPTFSTVLERVRQLTLDAYRNQDLPIEEILRVLQVARSKDRSTLFKVMFVLQNASPTTPSLSELSVQFLDVDPETAHFDLKLELIDEGDNGLSGWLEYSTDLFEAATIARMVAHLRILLAAIAANPEERISRLSLLPHWERRRILRYWNDTATRFGQPASFSERFARQVKRTPDAIAVSADGIRLNYHELARRSASIGDRLALEGVGRDVLVVLLADRGIEFLSAMIAAHRAGGAFLPLDPRHPPARLAQIVRHSGTPVVLASRNFAMTLEQALSGVPAKKRSRVLILEELPEAMTKELDPPMRSAPSSLAYVIYTSGSTGIPKGAMVEHRGLFNHLCSQIADVELSASDVVAQTAPQSFVLSVWQFLAPLMVGARVHVCADEVVRDPALLVNEIQREGITVLQIVPALLRGIVDQIPNDPTFRALSGLRYLMCCGEPLPPDLVGDWFWHFPNVPIINAYGSTEVSDDVATYHLTAAPKLRATVPIGRPIANIRLYVLDTHLNPVPIGVAGELFVGGIGVGRGYLNDPDQTRRRFLRDPFSKSRTARLYRTGDLGRWRADGTLEFLGRVDHQIKIRGCRIEPAEIEHVLLEHPDVQRATVLKRDDYDLGGEGGLVAHIVAAVDRQPKVNELRDFLRARLPAFMIPAGFIFLEHIPLTANGKVNRPALMAIRRELEVLGSESIAPRNSTEEVLAQIWGDLLKLSDVGIFDNFFDLGGHSLLAGQVMARIVNAFRVSLPIRALFEAPTVAELAQRIDEASKTQSNKPALQIARTDKDGPPPVSIVQEHVLRTERELPGLPQFNLSLGYRLQGPLNIPVLERSFAELVRRHESLRTGFTWWDDRPVPIITSPSDIDPCIPVRDIGLWSTTHNERTKALVLRKAELEAEQEAWAPFDMARPPLFRMRLFRLGADDHVLILILHHIIVDGWSIGIFIDELSELYSAFVAGRQPSILDPTLRFSDFARWQRSWCISDAATGQFNYWKEHLQDTSPIFPTNRAVERALLSSRVGYEPVHLPNRLVERLKAWSRSQQATLFMTLLTAFKALLMTRSGRKDICIATAMANRSQLSTERVIGLFENTTLIRTRIDPDLSFQEALSRVRESVLEAHARQELPFDILATRMAQEKDLDPALLIQAFFVVQNALGRPLRLPDVTVESFGDIYRQGQPVLPIDRTWITVMLRETPSGVTGSGNYKIDLFEPSTLQHWIADYNRILSAVAACPDTPLGRLASL